MDTDTTHGTVLDKMSKLERADHFQETLARADSKCRGCGTPKHPGLLIVCWSCFKYRTDITPLKYYEGTFVEWIETTKQRSTPNE